MTYYSPYTGNTLQQFAGSPSTIETTAREYKALGESMKTTADTLRDITESQISLGTDRLKEDAETIESDLRQAGVRYEKTGTALEPYAEALRTARSWYTRNGSTVSSAETRYLTANSEYQTLVYTPAPFDPDEAQTHSDRVNTAYQELRSAETEREDQWKAFDSTFDVWATAFEQAANGVAEAMDAAGNDDGRWDWISDALNVLGWVLVGLAVLALFVVAQPWATILLVTTAVLAAVHLAGNIYLYANGKASLSDVLWSAFGLVTLGAGAWASRAIRLASSGVDDLVGASRLASNMSVFTSGVRSFSMPRLLPTIRLNPFSVLMRGEGFAALRQWGPALANWTSRSGPRSATIAAEWAEVVIQSTPRITSAGWTALGSWGTGIGSNLFTLSPFYQPVGRP